MYFCFHASAGSFCSAAELVEHFQAFFLILGSRQPERLFIFHDVGQHGSTHEHHVLTARGVFDADLKLLQEEKERERWVSKTTSVVGFDHVALMWVEDSCISNVFALIMMCALNTLLGFLKCISVVVTLWFLHGLDIQLNACDMSMTTGNITVLPCKLVFFFFFYLGIVLQRLSMTNPKL